MAAAACLLGYGEVGLWLKKEAKKEGTWVVVDGNPYSQWMEDYGGERYQVAVKAGIGIMCAFWLLRMLLNVVGSCHGGYRGSRSAQPSSVRRVAIRLGAMYKVRKGVLGHGVEPTVNRLK
jgi:hypothetical protein